MTIRQTRIDVHGLAVDVVWKEIRNLHLGVYPPDGRVRVAAPTRLSADAVRLAIVSRIGWIRRQQRGFDRQERQSAREMVTGESHYVAGRRYRLRVIPHGGPARVSVTGLGWLEMRIAPSAGAEKREALLDRWHRERLRAQMPLLLEKWEPQVGVRVAEWGIRRMRTRWGTCNQAAQRIRINVELDKKPPSCLEYIVVHEMVHLLERQHNERFRALMDSLMPQWRACRDELNRAPLAHEDWSY